MQVNAFDCIEMRKNGLNKSLAFSLRLLEDALVGEFQDFEENGSTQQVREEVQDLVVLASLVNLKRFGWLLSSSL